MVRFTGSIDKNDGCQMNSVPQSRDPSVDPHGTHSTFLPFTKSAEEPFCSPVDMRRSFRYHSHHGEDYGAIPIQMIRSCEAVMLVHTKNGRTAPFADMGPLSLPISKSLLLTAGGML